jgi:cytochrome c-type biogenesis protein CcmE
VSTRSPARLVVALAVAGVLAVFLVYTALAGQSTPTLTPSQVKPSATSGRLSVVGIVVAPLRGDSHTANGLRFQLKDPTGAKPQLVDVVYHGTKPPPLFRAGRSVVVTGTYAAGRLQGTNILTKCPSKYTTAPTKA